MGIAPPAAAPDKLRGEGWVEDLGTEAEVM
jgi:hypothetical protein